MLGRTIERLGFDFKTLRIVWTLGVLFCLYQIREVLFVFVVAILLAYMLLPLVNLVDRYFKGNRRGLALAIVYLGLLGAVAAIGIPVGSYAADQAGALATRVQELVTSENALSVPIPRPLQSVVGGETYDVKPWLRSHGQQIVAKATSVTFRVLGALGSALHVIVVLILSFFFLASGDGIAQWIIESSPVGLRGRLRLIVDDMNHLLAEYMRALVLIALLTSVIYGIAFAAMGVPYSILLAVAAFPFEFVPVLGPLVSFVFITLVAWFSGFSKMIGLMVFFLVFRLFQDYVLQPRLMGKGVQLAPLAVMFGVFAGQELAGIPGAVLSVPALASLRILFRHLGRSADPTPPADRVS